jgi:hypothetical protein
MKVEIESERKLQAGLVESLTVMLINLGNQLFLVKTWLKH